MKKLNFLLIMPRIINKIGDGYSFPLGLPYISSALKSAGFNIFTYNLNNNHGNIYELMHKLIYDNKIDVVMTGGLSFQYYPLRQIVSTVRQVNNNIKVVVGGGIISGDPKAAMLALDADIGCIGEGEITSVNLCNALEKNISLENVNGLILKCSEGGGISDNSSTKRN